MWPQQADENSRARTLLVRKPHPNYVSSFGWVFIRAYLVSLSIGSGPWKHVSSARWRGTMPPNLCESRIMASDAHNTKRNDGGGQNTEPICRDGRWRDQGGRWRWRRRGRARLGW